MVKVTLKNTQGKEWSFIERSTLLAQVEADYYTTFNDDTLVSIEPVHLSRDGE